MVQKLVLGNDAFETMHEIFEDAQLERRELYDFAGLFYQTNSRIDLDIAVPNGWIRFAGRAAQQRSEAGNQFLRLERLFKVVVCACIQPVNPLYPSAASGQDQDRQSTARKPPALQDLKA